MAEIALNLRPFGPEGVKITTVLSPLKNKKRNIINQKLLQA